MRRRLRVVLLNLPWASYRRPSIQLGLLAEIGRRDGHEIEIAHLNLDLAARLGPAAYDAIAEHRSTALGDWLFAVAAFGARARPSAEFIAACGDEVARGLNGVSADLLADLVAFREDGALAFLREQLHAHDWSQADVFGLTSTFQQNTACFAMARLLKAERPGATVIAGGANFDGDMGREWAKAVPEIDVVVSGEGEVAFPALLSAIAAGTPLDDVPNLILRRSDGDVRSTTRAPLVRDLDGTPIPDYDDYFERARRLGILSDGARLDVDLPVETSRGCWWGERRHCTFCGLNGETMAYRSKSPDRAKAEFESLVRRYRSFRLFAVDNIANMRFHKTLFPALSEAGSSYDLFYEVKSGLSREQLRQLRQAGVTRIQPGIESLSTRVLGLMNKGVRAIANVNLLRSSAILGIKVSWNLLWGFPGEDEADYRGQSELAAKLVHLQPPIGASRIWLERFSPLFAERQAQERPPIPEASLRHVYPDGVDLARAAYFFEYDLPGRVPEEAYAELSAVVGFWKEAWARPERPRLDYHYSRGLLLIDDTRWPGREGVYSYEGDAADLYPAICERPLTVAQLEAKLGQSAADIRAALDEFCECGLAMQDGDQFLALALPHRAVGQPT